MESEDFYDSLDEGADDIIPYYDKSISRTEIELSGNSTRCSALPAGPNKSKLRRKKPGYGENLKSVSYLDMFHKRNGADFTNKSFRSQGSSESNISPNSFTTCDEFVAESFYVKSENSESCYDNHSTLRENPDLAIHISNTDLKNIHNEREQKTAVKTFARKRLIYSKINSNKLPEMGRLGPEIPTDKLELLRKRQQYGRKVSLIFGIKMKEKKVLENLKQEISNSKKL